MAVTFNPFTGTFDFTGSSSGGGVTTVSNSNGTLTISPTSGSVVASLNLGHANTWTAVQTFNAAGTWLIENTALSAVVGSFNTSTGAAGIGDLNGTFNVGYVKVTGTPFPMVIIDGADQGVTIQGGGDGASMILNGGAALFAGDGNGATVAGGGQGGGLTLTAGDGDPLGSPGGTVLLQSGADGGTGPGYIQINPNGTFTGVGAATLPSFTFDIFGDLRATNYHSSDGSTGQTATINEGTVVIKNGIVVSSGTKLKKSVTFVLNAPTSSDVFPIWQVPYAVTITKVWATVLGGTSSSFNIDHRTSSTLNSTGTNILNATLVATTTGASTTTFNSTNNVLSANMFVVFVASAVSGTVGEVVVEIDYTVN